MPAVTVGDGIFALFTLAMLVGFVTVTPLFVAVGGMGMLGTGLYAKMRGDMPTK